MTSTTSIFIGFGLGLLGMFLALPIATVMLVAGLVSGVLLFGQPFISTAGNILWSAQNSDILTCIPLFILMGEILLRSGIADGMYKGLTVWLGNIPGGLLHSNIGTCALFAATTGSSVACAATVGTVALPALDKGNYNKRISLGSLAAGGTLGILIPPSTNLLIYGNMTNQSVGKLFTAGVIPGILLTALFMGYIFLASWRDGKRVKSSRAEKLASLPDLVPPFIVFAIVMGSIYFGWATPTEAGSLGVITSLAFAILKRRFSLTMLHTTFIKTAQVTGMILLIVVCAMVLNLSLSLAKIPQRMTEVVAAMNLSFTGLMVVLIVFYLILGMFLDVLSIQVATTPIAYPIVIAAGGDPIWFGIFLIVMCEVALITPPMGMNLFVIQSVRQDRGKLSDTIWGAQPFALIMLLYAVFLIFVPGIATWLPSRMFG